MNKKKKILSFLVCFLLIASPAYATWKQVLPELQEEGFDYYNDLNPYTGDVVIIGTVTADGFILDEDETISWTPGGGLPIETMHWDSVTHDFRLSDDLYIEDIHPGLVFSNTDSMTGYSFHYHYGTEYDFALFYGTIDADGGFNVGAGGFPLMYFDDEHDAFFPLGDVYITNTLEANEITKNGIALDLLYPLRTEWLQNGFPNRTDSTISFADGNRRFTINPSGASFDYFIAGVKYTVSSSDVVNVNRVDLTDTEGDWWIYYDGSTLTATRAPNHAAIQDIYKNKAAIAIVFWDTDSAKGQLAEDRHGISMSPDTHTLIHETVGTRYDTGLALNTITVDQNGNANSHAQFGVDAGQIFDEDIEHTLNAIASDTGLQIWHRDGGGAGNWTFTTRAGYSMITTGVGGEDRLAYDNVGTLTEVTDGDFVLCHIFATSFSHGNPVVAIGQAEYATKKLAQQGALTEIVNILAIANISPELKPIASVIFKTRDAYTNDVNAIIVSTDTGDDYVDFRTDALNPAFSSAQDHGNLAGLSDDDHSAYMLDAGIVSDETIPVFDGIDGRTTQPTLVTIDDNDNVTIPGDIDLTDDTPHIAFDPSGGGDKHEIYSFDSEFYCTNVDDGVVLWRVRADNLFQMYDLYSFPRTAPTDNYIFKYDAALGRFAFEVDLSAAFDATVVDDLTWSDGTNATNTWTFDVSGQDHTMAFGNGLVTFSHGVTVSGTLEGATITEGGQAVWNATETDILDSTHYIADSIDDEHPNWGMGATVIGADDIPMTDEFDFSANTNIQDVMDDIDAAVASLDTDQDGDVDDFDATALAAAIVELDPTVDTADEIEALLVDDPFDFGTGALSAAEFNLSDGEYIEWGGDENITFNATSTDFIVSDDWILKDGDPHLDLWDITTDTGISMHFDNAAGGQQFGFYRGTFDANGTFSTVTPFLTFDASDNATLNAGTLTVVEGIFANLTGDVTGNADTVTTNANLTGEVTSVGNATTIADSITVANWSLQGATLTGVIDAGSATSLEIPNSTDPDLTIEGQISWDTDDDTLRGIDANAGNQVVVGQKNKTIQFTIMQPDDLDEDDDIVIWSNETGFTFHITEIKAWCDDQAGDDGDFTLVELTDPTDFTAETTIEAVTCSNDGTEVDYVTVAVGDIDHKVIENTHLIALDPTADDLEWVKVMIKGWLDANVN